MRTGEPGKNLERQEKDLKTMMRFGFFVSAEYACVTTLVGVFSLHLSVSSYLSVSSTDSVFDEWAAL